MPDLENKVFSLGQTIAGSIETRAAALRQLAGTGIKCDAALYDPVNERALTLYGTTVLGTKIDHGHTSVAFQEFEGRRLWLDASDVVRIQIQALSNPAEAEGTGVVEGGETS